MTEREPAFQINLHKGLFLQVLAGVLLVVTVFPAVTQSPESTITVSGSETLYLGMDTRDMKPEFNRYGEPQPVLEGINLRSHDDPFKTETFQIRLMPGQQLEYMANMKQGEVILYTWKVDGRVYSDFHAHQLNVDPDIWVRYQEGGDLNANGSLVAPYDGEHGWFWANMDNKPVNLELTVSGYYIDIFRVDL
jgi:hypothetical protein